MPIRIGGCGAGADFYFLIVVDAILTGCAIVAKIVEVYGRPEAVLRIWYGLIIKVGVVYLVDIVYIFSIIILNRAIINEIPTSAVIACEAVIGRGTLRISAVIPVGEIPVSSPRRDGWVQQGLGRSGIGHEPKIELPVPYACPPCH